LIEVCKHDDVELHYEAFGDDGDPLIILISGAGSPAEFWPTRFCEGLAARRFRVARFWHRDTGHSTHCDEPYSINLLVDDVLALQSELNAARAHFVGHSMGGYIAQLIATAQPDRALACVAMACGPLVSDEGKRRLGLSSPDDALWPKLLENRPQGEFSRDLPGWMASWQLLNGTLEVEEGLALPYTRALYDGPVSNHQVAENHIQAMTTVPDLLSEKLAACEVPFLYLHGEHDPLVPIDHGQKAAQLAKRGSFHALPDAGHMYFNQATWDHILEHVASHCGASAQA
jgi:pimeloyl-ACP methyl ester carboxylesterase